MVAANKKSIKELLDVLYKEVGVHLTRRINVKTTPELVTRLKDQFSHKPPTEIEGLHVHRIVDIDGFKFIFHGGRTDVHCALVLSSSSNPPSFNGMETKK